jgi:DNA phosphorothioation-associated putative methyltransferase
VPRSRRDLTAMARLEPSRPIHLAVEHGVLSKKTPFFDFGCGRGADVEWVASLGGRSRGWDPVHRPNERRTKTEVVGLTYVVNVIEDPLERDKVLDAAWKLTSGLLIVSARLEDERDEAHIRPHADGWMTSRGTFQRFFDHAELGEWIRCVLRVDPIPAAPGVWYVFRRSTEREAFLARRYMLRFPSPHQRKSDGQFKEHREILQELINFFALHGRLPLEEEITSGTEISKAFGSLGKAFRVVEVVTDRDEWLLLTERRRIDLLVYLALKFFDGNYRMSDLAPVTQRDVRAHYQSFAKATEVARKLLFGVGSLENISIACRSSTVGKLTPSALYVHIDAIEHLPGLLKVYEGCARRLIGEVPGANLIKLHRDSKKISYLSYPDFDTDPHPGLHRTDVVDLVNRSHRSHRYPPEANVPILHRKEEFLHPADPRWERYRDLTNREVAAGLYADTSRIGYRDSWNELVSTTGCPEYGSRQPSKS